jgi:hypothetical protein
VREFNVPPPGVLGTLAEHGLLEACERLGTLSDASNILVNSLDELPKEEEIERYGLCADDWRWSWGTRVVCNEHTLEVRSFESFSRFLLPDADPPNPEGRKPVFSGAFFHQVLDYNGERVLALRFGSDWGYGGYYRNFMLISVHTFVAGAWIDVLKKLVTVDQVAEGPRAEPASGAA